MVLTSAARVPYFTAVTRPLAENTEAPPAHASRIRRVLGRDHM
jgi:hypothetical protein